MQHMKQQKKEKEKNTFTQSLSTLIFSHISAADYDIAALALSNSVFSCLIKSVRNIYITDTYHLLGNFTFT